MRHKFHLKIVCRNNCGKDTEYLSPKKCLFASARCLDVLPVEDYSNSVFRLEGYQIVQTKYKATNTCILLLIHSYSEGETLQGIRVLAIRSWSMIFILLLP